MLTTIFRLFIQTPTGTPNPGENTTIDVSEPFDLIVYIIIPILLLIFYFTYRKKNRNNKD